MSSLFLNIYNVYPEAGDDQMYGTTKYEKWPKCSPASLRDQATILIRRTVHWRERSSLPIPSHIQATMDQIPSAFNPLRHFHFIRK